MLRFLLGVVIGAVLTYVVMTSNQPVRAPVPPSPSPAPSAAASAEQQVTSIDRALADASRTGRAVAVTIVFTEAQVQAAATAYFPQTFSGATLTDPVVRLRATRLLLDMNASLGFLKTTASVIATPFVSDGRPVVRIESATIGGAGIPDQGRQAIAAQLAGAIASGLPPKLTVNAVVVADGTLTVSGTANP